MPAGYEQMRQSAVTVSPGYFRLIVAASIACGSRWLVAAQEDQKQVCFKVAGPCPRFPEWAGSTDDSDYAYDSLGVAQMERCLQRAKEYHEWCGARRAIE